MSKPILFYSKNNTECINLWKYLESKNRLGEFLKVCVDGNSRIPKIINTVPSIFIKNRPLIYGHAIKFYLDSPNPNPIRQPFEKKNVQVNNNSENIVNLDKPPEIESSTNNLGGIADFNAIEMGSAFSDKYSFIQENPAPMNNQYQFLSDLKNNNITGHQVNSNNNNSSKKSELNNRFEEMQRSRNSM